MGHRARGGPVEPTTGLALIPLPARALVRAGTRALVLIVLPDGGQLTARRNAWAGMSSDAARNRARREAAHAVEAARTRRVRRVAEHG